MGTGARRESRGSRGARGCQGGKASRESWVCQDHRASPGRRGSWDPRATGDSTGSREPKETRGKKETGVPRALLVALVPGVVTVLLAPLGPLGALAHEVLRACKARRGKEAPLDSRCQGPVACLASPAREESSPGTQGVRGEKGEPAMTEEEIRAFVRQEMNQHCACGGHFPRHLDSREHSGGWGAQARSSLPSAQGGGRIVRQQREHGQTGLFSTQPFPAGSAHAVPVLKLSHAEEEEGQDRQVMLNTDDLEYESMYGEEEDYDEVPEMDSSEQPTMGAEPCSLPLDEGDCQRYTLRWYYNQRVTECRPFVYSGCRGNLNRFDSKEECELHCGQRPGADARGIAGSKVGGQPKA